MSLLFDRNIPLDSSADYRRLGVIVSFCALISLYVADLPAILNVGLSIWMLYALWRLLVAAKPHPSLSSLNFQQKRWVLDYQDGNHLTYERVQIAVDSGFFLLLQFSGISKSRWVVVFYDQMSLADLRQFNRMHAILS
ncbi:MAG: hypothetical protein NXI01_04580 [Gammaproteobacteria bacterium]|nr:hypothetical protein [Gammaproteobacteria bacterium]